MQSRFIAASDAPEDGIDPDILQPRLVLGETVQAFVTTRYLPTTTLTEPFHKRINATQLRSHLYVKFSFSSIVIYPEKV